VAITNNRMYRTVINKWRKRARRTALRLVGGWVSELHEAEAKLTMLVLAHQGEGSDWKFITPFTAAAMATYTHTYRIYASTGRSISNIYNNRGTWWNTVELYSQDGLEYIHLLERIEHLKKKLSEVKYEQLYM
jgi:hypothetical protein